VKKIRADNYSIWLGKKSLTKLDTSSYSKVAVLVDENTKKYCLNLLPRINHSIIIEIDSGEKNKNISTCNLIWEQLTKNNFDRNSLLINLGGGVIGDMGGFAASTYKRGIDFIQIPTTLLAMVDASIGGKLGVDFNGLKNQVGLFSDPRSVIINPIFLQTLAEEELKSGFSEVVKYALITDKRLWKKITNTPFNNLEWKEVIYTSLEIKNKIVTSDPKEDGERKKLNFGHTFGHAIESYYLEKGTPILHGEAIFMGIILESEISDLTQSEKNEIKNYILSNFALPYTPKKPYLHKFLLNDKKNQEGKINFSLLKGIGNCTINNLFTEDEL
tara:strand:+ start:291 stop:1280 length:990 start_codon:yes stop_codon:yes gene_type:complete